MSHCSCKFVSQQMPFPDETNAVCSGGWANKIHHAVFKLDPLLRRCLKQQTFLIYRSQLAS